MSEQYPSLSHSQTFNAPPAKAGEMGSAPIVLVRTIEETKRDQQWLADEMDRKRQRKEEAARLQEKQNEERRLQNHIDVMEEAKSGTALSTKDIERFIEVDSSPQVQAVRDAIMDDHINTLNKQLADQETALLERKKYEKIWEFSQYREVAPGEDVAGVFIAVAKPRDGAEIIDFGSGTGRGALTILVNMNLIGRNARVHMLDFAENSLDPEVREALITQAHCLAFNVHDLNMLPPITAEYGYCTDVLEHIPPNFMDRVVTNILRSAQHVFFQISCVEDRCGALIGEPLHLSVHPYQWWHDYFTKLGCVIHWSQDADGSALFYVTAWAEGRDVVDVGVLNIGEQVVREQVRHNIAQGWQQVTPHYINEQEVMILGGGPSLNEFEEEIRTAHKYGKKIVTLNGAFNWCMERGIGPVTQIIVDAREFNNRFTKIDHDNLYARENFAEKNRYLIASQVHPSVLEGLPKDRTWLWHTTAEMVRDILREQYEIYWGIPGGSTVLLRAIPLLCTLGFHKFTLYGCDSCLSFHESQEYKDEFKQYAEGKLAGEPAYEKTTLHHAYRQDENEDKMVIPVTLGGRTFHCHLWMVSQAQEFIDLIKMMGNMMELDVKGDGLLAWILTHAASQQDLIVSKTPHSEDEFSL